MYIQGDAVYGGGGAGGRVAVYHTDQNHFAGQYLVHGGKGYAQRGGAGTMFREDTFSPTVHRELVVDNGGHEVSAFTAGDN